jgi:hypothetical protein
MRRGHNTLILLLLGVCFVIAYAGGGATQSFAQTSANAATHHISSQESPSLHKATNDPEFTECVFSLGEFNIYYGPGTYDFQRKTWSYKAIGRFAGNRFTGTINSTYWGGDLQVTGSVILKCAEGLTRIDTITVDMTEVYTFTSAGGSVSVSTERTHVVATNIPNEWQSSTIGYTIYGNETCDHIKDFQWEYESETNPQELVRYECKSISEISAVLSYAAFKPTENELVIAGEEYTLQWGIAAATVDILLSTDSGKVFHPIALGVANSGMYDWDVPEDTLSRKCRIQIRESSDHNNFVLSDIFRIKGYILTRITADGQYEPYTFSEDSWSYDNTSRATMWPASLYVDYEKENDPFTNKPYPRDFTSPPWYTLFPINAKIDDFPSWPLFVAAFGTEYCYKNLTEGTYSQEAITKWTSIKRKWIGSCVGFSTTSLLIFQDEQTFLGKYPIDKSQELHALPLTDARRNVINRFQVTTCFDIREEERKTYSSKTTNEILDEIKEILLNENRGGDKWLSMTKSDFRLAHAVAPYSLKKEAPSSTTYRLHVYNSDILTRADTLRFVTASSYWERVENPSEWFGTNKGLYLAELTQPHSEYPGMSSDRVFASTTRASQPQDIKFYITSNSHILITDHQGHPIGYADSVIYGDLSPGFPIIPIGGELDRPLGYMVPQGQYSIAINNSADSLTSLSVFTDSLICSYWRSNADSTQTDQLRWGNGVSISNPDQQPKSTNLETIQKSGSAEFVTDILNLEIHQGDSIDVSTSDNQSLDIVNHGATTGYTLRLRVASEVQESTFGHEGIGIQQNSRHRISPDWSNINDRTVTIYVDYGNDGTIDDTIHVQNQLADVNERTTETVPDKFSLSQNYPNPFNSETIIQYQIPRAAHVLLRIYTLDGQVVATLIDEDLSAGSYSARWDGRNTDKRPVASGMYLSEMVADDFVGVRKLLLLR